MGRMKELSIKITEAQETIGSLNTVERFRPLSEKESEERELLRTFLMELVEKGILTPEEVVE